MSGFFALRTAPDWAEGLNFAGPRVRTSFWGWALLAFGLMGLLHVADLHQQVQAEQDEAAEVMARLSQNQSQDQRQPPSPARGQAAMVPPQAELETAPPIADEALRQAAQLALWLGHPWGRTLDHVDATALQEGAVLMQFSLDLASLAAPAGAGAREDAGNGPELRLQAAVPDDTTAWRWVQALGPQATLRSREPLAQGFATARGAYSLRIDVVQRVGARP
jgi:hypothetical protein